MSNNNFLFVILAFALALVGAFIMRWDNKRTVDPANDPRSSLPQKQLATCRAILMIAGAVPCMIFMVSGNGWAILWAILFAVVYAIAAALLLGIFSARPFTLALRCALICLVTLFPCSIFTVFGLDSIPFALGVGFLFAALCSVFLTRDAEKNAAPVSAEVSEKWQRAKEMVENDAVPGAVEGESKVLRMKKAMDEAKRAMQSEAEQAQDYQSGAKQSAPELKPLFCPYCGQKLEETDAAFCPKCGKRLA